MRNLTVVLPLAALAAWLTGLSAEPVVSADKERVEQGPIRSVIPSAILKEDRTAIVHLPASYHSAGDKRYPVMYVLDGTSQDGPAATALAALAVSGEAPEAIVVGIPNTSGNRSRDYTPPFMRVDPDVADSKKGGGDQFLLFVEKELIPFIDKQYRTANYRTISGNSRGGLLAMYSLLEKPELFQARFCYSSPFHREENLIVNRTREFLARNGSRKSFLYLTVGADETDKMKAGCESMKSLLQQQTNSITWFLEYTPKAVHADNAYLSIPGALKKWGSHMSTTADKR